MNVDTASTPACSPERRGGAHRAGGLTQHGMTAAHLAQGEDWARQLAVGGPRRRSGPNVRSTGPETGIGLSLHSFQFAAALGPPADIDRRSGRRPDGRSKRVPPR
jgi:hypothetical protein